jgi:hypothetical protein
VTVSLGREPTLIIQGVVLALNAVQVAAISMPDWAHTLIIVVSVALGALLNRSQVTPVTKPPTGA